MLFDSHAHLCHEAFDDSREEIIKKLHALEIGVVNIGVGSEEFKKVIDLSKKIPKQIWAAIGFHPNDTERNDEDFTEFKSLAMNKNVIAIGECGLDYYKVTDDRRQATKERQEKIFIEQIKLAQELKKPLIIHCRPTLGTMDAYEDAVEILKFSAKGGSAFGGKNGNGVAHFFSGSKEIAKKFLDLGFYISFAGPITFHLSGSASPYKEIVEYVPNDKILAETDSPFAAPLPYRGKRNEPAFVEYVVRQIAEWKGLSFEEAARLTTENAENLFCLKTLF